MFFFEIPHQIPHSGFFCPARPHAQMDPADVGAGAYIASVVILTNLAIGDV